MRYLTPCIVRDLQKKMVLIGGPRQVGKATLAKNILKTEYSRGRYFNWDVDEDRHDILQKKWANDDALLVLDEIHKYPRWKQWLKGVYDSQGEAHNILVTGSARMDVYKRGGDSMMGRYHYWRLHPFALDEIPQGMTREEALRRLMTVGGFPEPFLDGNEQEAKRWRKERVDRVLREDVRDLEMIREIQLLGIFADELRKRVGSPITLSNLARDLEIAPKTAKTWLNLLEKMYVVFIVRPYTRSLPRAILKPPKVYFFDNADVIGDEGAVFENLVATNILKRLHYLEDSEGDRYELRYIRDKEGREIDFVILKNGNILELVEAKYSDGNITKHLQYYARHLSPPQATQVVGVRTRSYDRGRLSVKDCLSYFSGGKEKADPS